MDCSCYELRGQWTAQGVYFVSRMKDNAVYEAVGKRPVPQKRHILRDEAIELRGLKAQDKDHYPVRLIELYAPLQLGSQFK
jgi:hypothetical protein